ncbi:hypothetical protein AB4090_13845 [Acidithiobacillus sp. IBUN Pt1247-S3]|uniref:hypothetical protein n=1 Tax=Acidithiobacillus sp. IBUN Pt1247-S3 TaxID=3166642 RepID=UPI0034E41401
MDVVWFQDFWRGFRRFVYPEIRKKAIQATILFRDVLTVIWVFSALAYLPIYVIPKRILYSVIAPWVYDYFLLSAVTFGIFLLIRILWRLLQWARNVARRGKDDAQDR